jgi:hypothetical protein
MIADQHPAGGVPEGPCTGARHTSRAKPPPRQDSQRTTTPLGPPSHPSRLTTRPTFVVKTIAAGINGRRGPTEPVSSDDATGDRAPITPIVVILLVDHRRAPWLTSAHRSAATIADTTLAPTKVVDANSPGSSPTRPAGGPPCPDPPSASRSRPRSSALNRREQCGRRRGSVTGTCRWDPGAGQDDHAADKNPDRAGQA